jgi:hypothetical protein
MQLQLFVCVGPLLLIIKILGPIKAFLELANEMARLARIIVDRTVGGPIDPYQNERSSAD